MGYLIKCESCSTATWANNIVDLIEQHTDRTFGNDGGKIKCAKCGSDAYIHRESKLQEGETWDRYVKGVIRITTGYPTYSPYVFLTANEKGSKIEGIHFNYYKDTRSEKGGKLKHGHGPGGAPVLTRQELLDLVQKLIQFGCLSLVDIENLVQRLREQSSR